MWMKGQVFAVVPGGQWINYEEKYMKRVFNIEEVQNTFLNHTDQPCRYNSSGMAAQCKGYKEVPKGDERALAVALFKVGPVSVGIDATQPSFQFYQRGQ
ncbi:hypothetical protein CRENBAI_008327 [Crenichthys baileyi]|uniref:Peptidase C1A papain C-terminal domain-containing protein n=1 Tax=Crenichthys baileyi TaxID=28760 RepID=A0AAV9QQ53_9TELE